MIVTSEYAPLANAQAADVFSNMVVCEKSF
jgi:hypothetical protein